MSHKMRIAIIFFLAVCIGPSFSQLVSNIRFRQHATYMLKVVEETVHDIEDLGWCSLKIPEFTEEHSFFLINRNLTARATYKNGFVHTIQHIDVLTSSVQQRWTWNATMGSAIASLESQLRLQNLVLGFDVVAEIDDDRRHYTAKVMHELVAVNFAVVTYMSLNETDITITIPRPAAPRTRISYVPDDEYSDMIGALYDIDATRDAIMHWSQIIQPLMLDVVVNRVVFPTLCYDCAA